MDAKIAVPALPAGADHPVFRQVFDYWASKAPPGLLPGRQHIDPVELKLVLRHLFLLDVERIVERMRFRVRLMGTALNEIVGRDATGQYLDKTEMQPEALARMRRLVETRQLYHVVENLPTPLREFVVVERLALPLAADGRNVDMIFGACVVQPRRAVIED